MSIEPQQITVSGVRVQVWRKGIKNLHLGVYPPHGRVRVAAPLQVSDAAVRLAVIGKLGWIKRQRARFAAQPRESRREMVSGESHYFLGRRYRLRGVKHEGPPAVVVRNRFIELSVRPGLAQTQREAVLERWYRQQLKQLIPPLIEKWQAILGVTLAEWGRQKDENPLGHLQCRGPENLVEPRTRQEAGGVPGVHRRP